MVIYELTDQVSSNISNLYMISHVHSIDNMLFSLELKCNVIIDQFMFIAEMIWCLLVMPMSTIS